MNTATLLTLATVVLVVSWAAFRTYRMIRSNDLCYACPNRGQCACCNPINCSIKKD